MTHDDTAIHGLVQAFVAGWNAKDGEACARPFAADADFTAITGLQARGRELIGRGHAEILSTIYRETRMSATMDSLRYLRPDVAVAEVTLTYDQDGGLPFAFQSTKAGLVATKEEGTWSIAVFRNMVPFGRPPAGPLERAHQPEGAGS